MNPRFLKYKFDFWSQLTKKDYTILFIERKDYFKNFVEKHQKYKFFVTYSDFMIPLNNLYLLPNTSSNFIVKEIFSDGIYHDFR